MIKVKRLLCGAACVASIFAALFLTLGAKSQNNTDASKIQALTLWQIDGFEGGTGSRAEYIQQKANDYKTDGGVYVSVISLSADAARSNLQSGNAPDLISFSGGEWGLEGAINANYEIKCWCYGAYCLLALGDNADFSQATALNTVINEGKSNLSAAAALFCGLNGAATQSATYAYVDLINGKYEYLLGTQRDIYRLNARKVSYSVKPITEFNDLYQLIAICSIDGVRAAESKNFIDYLLSNGGDVYKLGLLGGETGQNEYIKPLEDIGFNYTLKTPISVSARGEILSAIETNQINKLKTLLK